MLMTRIQGWIVPQVAFVLVTFSMACTPTESARLDAGSDLGSGSTDAGDTDANVSMDAGGDSGPDANGDAAEDASVAIVPCTPELVAEPGEWICTGITSADPNSEPQITFVSAAGNTFAVPSRWMDGNIYAQIPLRLDRTCGGGTASPTAVGDPTAGALSLTVVVDGGPSSDVSIDVNPLQVDTTRVAGSYSSAWFRRLRDAYSGTSDPTDAAAAMRLEAVAAAFDSAMGSDMQLFSYGGSGCIPYYNCDCDGDVAVTAQSMRVLDAFLENSEQTLPGHVLNKENGPPEATFERCDQSARAMARCTSVLGSAAANDRIDSETRVKAAGGAVLMGVFTVAKIIQERADQAVGVLRRGLFALNYNAAKINAEARLLALAAISFANNPAGTLMGDTLAEEITPDCSQCVVTPPKADELASAGCGSSAGCAVRGSCGCASDEWSCTGFAAGAGYCSAYCVGADGAICVAEKCLYLGSVYGERFVCP